MAWELYMLSCKLLFIKIYDFNLSRSLIHIVYTNDRLHNWLSFIKLCFHVVKDGVTREMRHIHIVFEMTDLSKSPIFDECIQSGTYSIWIDCDLWLHWIRWAIQSIILSTARSNRKLSQKNSIMYVENN